MFICYLLPLLAFIPGSILLYLFSSKHNIKLSFPEIMILGSIIWNYILVSCGYIIGILSNQIKEFFIFYSVVSLVLLAYFGYRLTYILIEKKHFLISFRVELNKVILLISCVPLLLMLFTLTMSHSLYIEFDAIFTYLPLAKSIIKTGGLQYDYYRQSGLTTTNSPAMPIMYAWLMFLCDKTEDFNIIVRIIPITYILLTTLVIYLISKEIINDFNIATVAIICFMSMPITFAIVSNYSLYLDIPFTFLLYSTMLIILKIYDNNNIFWWFMLGLVLSLFLLEKTLAYLLFPALLTLILIYFLPRPRSSKTLIVLAAISSLAFTATFNTLFLLDISTFSTNLLLGFIIRQIPILIVCIIFSGLLFKTLLLNNAMIRLNAPYVLFFSISFVPVLVYILRSILCFGAVTIHFPIFNEDWKIAMALYSKAIGISKALPTNILTVLRWDILLTSVNLGAVFLLPLLVGLFDTFHSFIKESFDRKYFVLLSFLLMLLGLWSWWYYCDYKTSNLRVLFYFAPLFAIFVAKGLKAIADLTGIKKSLSLRFVLFNSLNLIYLWAFKCKIGQANVEQLRRLLVSLDVADIEMLIVFAFFFVVSYYPLSYKLPIRLKNYIKKHFSPYLFLLITLLMPLLALFAPVSLTGLSNIRSELYYVPESWENDLYEVISYINQTLKDNFTIVTSYALPISYFTNHPVIEVYTSEGIMNLLKLSTGDLESVRNSLIVHGIRYLLYPKSSHSLYGIFKNLSKEILVLNTDFINKCPYVVVLKEFTRFKLFKVLTNDDARQYYRYLTLFEDGWRPLNNYTTLMKLNTTVLIYTSTHHFEVIADDFQTSFWKVAKANPTDEISLSDDAEIKVNGINSLKICINGTGNMNIGHNYEVSQDWSAFKTLTFYLFGANTSKDILITFHTKGWHDYYFASIKDDFIGWKKISLPLDSFQANGKPSWSNITYIEILLGGRSAIYRIDQMRLESYIVGLKGYIPSIATNFSKVDMVISCKGFNLQSPVRIKLISSYGELDTTLIDGINLITIPSELLKTNATLTIYFYQSNIDEKLELYYLGITDK